MFWYQLLASSLAFQRCTRIRSGSKFRRWSQPQSASPQLDCHSLLLVQGIAGTDFSFRTANRRKYYLATSPYWSPCHTNHSRTMKILTSSWSGCLRSECRSRVNLICGLLLWCKDLVHYQNLPLWFLRETRLDTRWKSYLQSKSILALQPQAGQQQLLFPGSESKVQVLASKATANSPEYHPVVKAMLKFLLTRLD